MQKEYVKDMFAGISKYYDFLNALLSLNRDTYWRSYAVSRLRPRLCRKILDICAGTGDVAIEIGRRKDFRGEVIAADFCEEMLAIGRQKVKRKGFGNIFFVHQDAEALTFGHDTFDGAIVAFGIRNIPNIKAALGEMQRVVKAGGRIIVLEFSKPSNLFFRWLYYLYFLKILPVIGGIVSKKGGAYTYLPSSVLAFPERDEFASIMREVGMRKVLYKDLTFGIVTVYVGIK